MVYTCFLCKWRSDKHPQRSYHKFPSNNELKQKWLDILGKSNVSVGTRTTLCCLHFEEECFRYGLVYGRKVLKDGSLPTLYLTKSDTNSKAIELIDKIKLPASTDSSLQRRHLTTDNVQMKDPALNIEHNTIHVSNSPELDIENNHEEFPIKICLPGGSPTISYPRDEQTANSEILRLKRKVLTLQCSVKRLRSSNSRMKLQLSDLQKKVNKYENEKKIWHISHNQPECLDIKIKEETLNKEGQNLVFATEPSVSKVKLENIPPSDVMVTIKKEPDIEEDSVGYDMEPHGEIQNHPEDFKIEIKEELPGYYMTLESINYK